MYCSAGVKKVASDYRLKVAQAPSLAVTGLYINIMLERTHRFHGYNSLRQTYKAGRSLHGPLMVLKFVENPRRAGYRVAVVVSRKVSKSAVVRNRIRRRIYETVRHYQPHILKPYDMVFMVFSDQLADLPAKQLNKLIRSQLVRAEIITASARENNHGIVKAKES